MSRVRVRLMLVVAASVLGTMLPSPAQSSTQMYCSEPLEPVCAAIGVACRTLDTLEAKVAKLDVINCQLG